MMPPSWPVSGLDLVPDAETALKLGKVLAESYYGRELVSKYEPYHARPYDGDWLIHGTAPGGAPINRITDKTMIVIFGGGFPELLIARNDARALRIALSR
jgi:hypothetical protein